MERLFTPFKIGRLEIPNRIIRSATYENMATEDGKVTPELLKMYSTLARGGAGLIITGFIYVSPDGKAAPKQMSLHSDEFIPGIRDLVNHVHENGSLIAAELVHAGASTGKRDGVNRPLSPSKGIFNPLYLNLSSRMADEDISRVIGCFAEAAGRAKSAGFDAIELHAAHGYLLNQFLSRFYNKRHDGWGGDEEKRFKFAGEVIKAVRSSVGEDFPLIVKLNSHDGVPGGLKAEEASRHAKRMEALGINAIEISSGNTIYSPFDMCRGDVPSYELVKSLYPPAGFIGYAIKPLAKIYGRRYKLVEGYNVERSSFTRREAGIPLIVVGGMRDPGKMAGLIEGNKLDAVALSRPFVREPGLVKRIKKGDTRPSTCFSCNLCLAAVSGPDLPLKCYSKKKV